MVIPQPGARSHAHDTCIRGVATIVAAACCVALGVGVSASRTDAHETDSPRTAQTADLPAPFSGALGGATTAIAVDGANWIAARGVRVARITPVDGRIEHVASSRPLDGMVAHVAVAGDRAVALTDGGAWTLDLSEREAAPRLVGWIALRQNEQPMGVRIVGNRAWLALGDGGIVVLDIADMLEPRRAAHVAVASRAIGVAAREDLVAFTTSTTCALQPTDPPGNLVLLDPRDASPSRIGTLTISSCAPALALDGDRLWLLDGRNGLAAIDIADPRMPRLLGHGTYATDTSGFRHPVWLGVHRGCAVIGFPHGAVERQCEGEELGPRGVVLPGHGPVTSAALLGDTLVLSGPGAGVRTLDIGPDAEAATVPNAGWEPTIFPGRRIGVHGDTLWLGAGAAGRSFYRATTIQGGVWRLDVRDPAAPVPLAGEPFIGEVYPDDLAIADDRVYIYPDMWRVRVLNALDGATLGFIKPEIFPIQLRPTSQALIAETLGDLLVYGPLGPDEQSRIGAAPGTRNPRRGAEYYAAAFDNVVVAFDGLTVDEWDVADLANPVHRRSWPLAARGVAVTKRFIFQLDAAGLHVFDRLDPARSELGFIDLDTRRGIIRSLIATDDTVALLDAGTALVFDVSNPPPPHRALPHPRLPLRRHRPARRLAHRYRPRGRRGDDART